MVSTATADLVAFTQEHNYNLTVVGLPKTADNDVYPLWQTAGAFTVAEEGAKFFAVYEISCNPSMLIVHEVMGRGFGDLTAATAHIHRNCILRKGFNPVMRLTQRCCDARAVLIPEMPVSTDAEAAHDLVCA